MIRQETFYLAGGMDMISPHIAKEPGRLIGCLNIWQEGGILGYWRMAGNEVMDGQPAPSSYTDPVDIESARTLISALPGEGACLGVCRYDGNQFAFRNAVGGASAKMFKSTVSGWSEVVPGETIDFITGTAEFLVGEVLTDGTATGNIERVVKQSGVWGVDATGYIVLSSVVGIFVNPGTITSLSGSATSSSSNSIIILQPDGDYEIIVHNFYGASDMRNIYWVNGVDTAYMFNGTAIVPIRKTGMPTDMPRHLVAHLSRLWLIYAGGSIQRSEVKDPLSGSALLGAGEMATGSEVVKAVVLAHGTLVFLCQNKDSIWMLQGATEDEWMFTEFSSSVGAKKHTVQGVNNLVFLSENKLTTLQASQKFGDFSDKDLDKGIAPFVKDRIPVASVSVLNKSQYRLFFDDGYAVCVTFNRSRPVTSTVLKYQFVAKNVWSSLEDGVEFIYVGAEDGFVYQLDSGNSENGEKIEGFIRLPFYHYKSIRQNKRFLKMTLELDGPTALTGNTGLTLFNEFDYGSGDNRSSASYPYTIMGGGTYWDGSGVWNSFAYDAPDVEFAEAFIDGIAENMNTYIGFESIYDVPFNLQALTVDYFILGRKR